MPPRRKTLDIAQRLIPFHQAFVVPTDKAYCVYTHSHQVPFQGTACLSWQGNERLAGTPTSSNFPWQHQATAGYTFLRTSFKEVLL